MTAVSPSDPLGTLREYRKLGPWNLRDLASVAGALLEASGVRPTNAAASVRPSQRTVRYYVTRGLVAPPAGRGTGATYSYRHLLQVLLIKIRQMEGVSLNTVVKELADQAGDTIERRVAVALGPSIPAPSLLALGGPGVARGRAGQAMHMWNTLAEGSHDDLEHTERRFVATKWHRIPVVRGLELHVHEGHPLAAHTVDSSDIAKAVRLAINRILRESP
jgi:DNA-binding transcriptional MerR regulator